MSNIKQITAALQKSWSADTSVWGDELPADNPARGQCVVSSLVVQDYLGGDLYRVQAMGDGINEKHYYNVLDDGTVIDTTRSQYKDLVVSLTPAPVDLKGRVQKHSRKGAGRCGYAAEVRAAEGARGAITATMMNMKQLSLRAFPTMPIVYAVLTFGLMGLVVSSDGLTVHRVVGALLCVVAFACWIVARLQLGDNFSLDAKARRLVTTGFYAKLRHPVYVFSILALSGVAVFFNHWLVYALLIPLVLLEFVRKRREEETLLAAFGKQYESYQKQTWF